MKKLGLFIHTYGPGGAERLIVEIAKNAPKYDFQVEVLHFGNLWIEARCNELNIPNIIIPFHKDFKSLQRLPIFVWKFRRFLKKRKIDVLHSHLFDVIFLATFATCLSGIRHIGTLHDTYSIEENTFRKLFLHIPALLGTVMVTVSKSMEKYFRGLGLYQKKAFTTIYNGVDLEKFKNVVNNKIRREIGITADELMVIYVGRVVSIKGVDILVKAFALLPTDTKAKLVIAGDGPEIDSIKTLVQEKQLDSKVIFLGFRNDIPQLLKASDIFVHASHSEGLSYAIIEALAAGLPVVATDIGSNHKLINVGQNGYLVKSKNPAEFAKALKILFENKQQRKEFGIASKNKAHNLFSMATMMSNYAVLYKGDSSAT